MSVRLRLLLGMLALVFTAAAPPVSSAPLLDQQWGLHRIRAPEAWEVSQGEGIMVAIVDSGVDLTHPDLVDSFARRPDGSVLGYDFVERDDDPTDEHGHGTIVAGIIATKTPNASGMASVAPRARLMPVRVLDSRGLGTKSSVEEGIRWAVDHGADVVNLSLEIAREVAAGSESPRVASSPDRVVRYAWSRGVVVVAAAGSDNADFTGYPSDSPVVLVGATNERDDRADFSDPGRPNALMAPGVDVISTWCSPCGSDVQHRIGQFEGTSYAAAHVTGGIALLRAAGYGPAAAVTRLRQSARDIGAPGPDGRTGHGRIDVAAALGLPSSSRGPRVVLDYSGTRPGGAPGGAIEETGALVRTRETSGSVHSWALLAAGLLLIDIAALCWVAVGGRLAPGRDRTLVLVNVFWRRGVAFVRLLRGEPR